MGDHLFPVHNNFHIGAYQSAINAGADLSDLGETEATERDAFVYRAYIALGSHQASAEPRCTPAGPGDPLLRRCAHYANATAFVLLRAAGHLRDFGQRAHGAAGRQAVCHLHLAARSAGAPPLQRSLSPARPTHASSLRHAPTSALTLHTRAGECAGVDGRAAVRLVGVAPPDASAHGCER
jgi:hypothetical protein